MIDTKVNPVITRYVCDCGKECYQKLSLHIHKKYCNYIRQRDEELFTHDDIIYLLNENENLKNIIILQNKMIIEKNKIIDELTKQDVKSKQD